MRLILRNAEKYLLEKKTIFNYSLSFFLHAHFFHLYSKNKPVQETGHSFQMLTDFSHWTVRPLGHIYHFCHFLLCCVSGESRSIVQSIALNPVVPWWTHYQSFPLSVCALMILPSQLILPCHVNCSWNPADSGIPSIKALWLSLPESQPLQLLHFQQWEHIKEVWRQLLTYQAAILAIKKGLRRQWVEQSVLVDKDKTIACNYHAANDYIGS